MSDETIAFLECVIVRQDLVFISALEGEQTKVIQWMNGECAHFMIDWPTTAMTACADPLALHSMGPDGDIHVFQDETRSRENIAGPGHLGPLRCMRMIGGVNYAAGMQRQVYRRRGADDWVSIGDPILNKDGIKGFNSLDGYSPQEIYAAGLSGEVWCFDGQQWQRRDVPTSLALQRVVCADNGQVYIVGQAGLILAGRHTQWDVLDTGDNIQDLWGCAWFNGDLYVASSKSVYKWTAQGLRPLDIGSTGFGAASYLAAGEGMLWSIGQRHIAYSLDGERWTGVTSDATAC